MRLFECNSSGRNKRENYTERRIGCSIDSNADV